jgi:hypothetical protein
VSRKPDGTQRSGRFTAPSAAGGFGGADTSLSRLARPFVPKPFRSTGGMSTSADTMASISMGRHNVDEELPDDQVNINAIVDKKVSDRRYLPRKINNMRHFLNTTPISESLRGDDDEIHMRARLYEKVLNEFVENIPNSDIVDFLKRGSEDTRQKLAAIGAQVSTDSPVLTAPPEEEKQDGFMSKVMTGLSVIAPFVRTAGDVYYGYHAFQDFKNIEESAATLTGMFNKLGADIDMLEDPAKNEAKFEALSIPSNADRAVIQDMTIKIAMKCYSFLSNLITSIPLDLVPGLALVDTVIDVALVTISGLGPSADPTGEKIVDALMTFSSQYNQAIREAEETLRSLGKLFGLTEETLGKMNLVSNFIGNLALAHTSISSYMVGVSAAPFPDVLAERKRRKKLRANEMSTTAGVAGYTGPMQGPKDPKKFYSTMAKAAGSEYLVDPVKNSKPKP